MPVSQFEVLEYLRVFGTTRKKHLQETFGRIVDWKLQILLAKGFIKKIRLGNKHVVYQLAENAHRYLEYRRLKSFIDGNKFVEKVEQRRMEQLGMPMWRPD